MKTKLPYVTALFAVALVVSNVIAGKLVLLGGLVLPAAVVLFPIVYILGDIIPEIYGLEEARKVIWIGFIANAFAVLFFWITLYLPSASFFQGQEAFQMVLGFTPRLLLASMLAYLIGTNLNAWVLVKIKKATNSKYLWLRTISSTVVGELADSAIFITVAFFGVIPTEALPALVLAQATFKIVYEILATPVTYLIVNWIKNTEMVNAAGD